MMKGGRQWWVLTHCHLVFVCGRSSSYMDSHCCMWVVDVDVVCGRGHIVGGCVTVVVVVGRGLFLDGQTVVHGQPYTIAVSLTAMWPPHWV